MKVWLSRLLVPIDRIVQSLVPPVHERVCYISTPDYTDNAYYMYRHLLRTRDDIEHVWLVLDSSVTERVQREFRTMCEQFGRSGHTLRVVYKHTPFGYWLYATSRCVFHTHGGFSFSSRAPRRHVVNLWHGMPIKCVGALNHISPNPFRTFGTLHVATSDMFRYIIACAFEISPDRVKVCGLPRCDALTDATAVGTPKAEIVRRLKLPDHRKLLLWLPTYRSEGVSHPGKLRSFLDDLPAWFLPALVSECQEQRCEIVIKLHPKDPLNQADIGSLQQTGVTVVRSSEWLAEEIQLYDLIAASDALLSDVSSVLIDYLVTERPVGVVGFDQATYTRDLVFPMEYVLRSARIDHLVDAESLTTFVGKISRPDRRTIPQEDVSAVLYLQFDGMAAESFAKAVDL